jgi:hypothetical protein
MAGYSVVFDSIFTGTLCGKYPDTAAWLFLLALKDKNGVIDMTPQYISSVTGMPVADLMACINRFMEPDPHSRSTAEQGRRLVPLNGERDWGWRIVNHHQYRERARLISKNEREVESGSNKERLKTAAHRRSPPETAADPLSEADAKAEAKKKPSLRSGRAPVRARERRVPKDFAITAEMRSWAKEACPNVDIDRETECFRDHEFRDPHSDWLAVWRQWMRRSPEFKRNGGAGISREDTGWRPSE